MKEIAIDIIRDELKKRGIKVIKIILFGSRVRGDFKDDSDWDFFVVVNREVNPREKREIIGEIQIKLAMLKIPNDILIVSKEQAQKTANDVGHITYYALKYGVEL